jgi:hypothetical protein
MANTAASLVDHVLPKVPVRQWVLTLPYPLRYRCAWDAMLMSEVLRAFMRALFADQRRRARRVHGIERGHNGSVTFIQRFGSALNLAPHFHTLVLDGVYPGPSYDLGSFVPLPPPETEDIARVLAGTARRILRILERRGLDSDEDALASDDPLLALLTAASIRSRIATGPEAGERWRRLGDRVEPLEDGEDGVESKSPIPPRCVREGGMSLHADVAVPANDRNRLERLCRYAARPPLALDRLEAMPAGRLAYRLKSRWRDGTTHVVMERHELLERLAPLIPPPRAHQVRYHGVLAPCASGRDQVVPASAERVKANDPAGAIETDLDTQTTPTLDVERGTRSNRAASPLIPDSLVADCDPALARASEESPSMSGAKPISPRRLLWAELIQRVFEVDALCCPKCGGRLRVLSAITDPVVAARILDCLALPSRAPPLAISGDRAGHSDFDEDWVGGISEFDFDQSQPSNESESGA